MKEVGVEVGREGGSSVGLGWLVKYGGVGGEKSMEEGLGKEMLDGGNNRGGGVKKGEESEKMGEGKKGFGEQGW